MKSCCLSVGSNVYGIASLVPGHVGLVLHAGVVTLGEKGLEKERKGTGRKHTWDRGRRKFG